MEKENENSINSNRRKLLGLAGVASAGALLSPLLSKAAPSTIIESGSNVDTASYIIFQDSGIIYAKNGTTGKIDFQGSDASGVINNAIATLTNGGKIFLKKGAYDIDTNILINSNMVLQGEGTSTIFDLADHGHILVNGKNDVKICDLLVDGIHQTITNDPPTANVACISVLGDSSNVLIDNVVIEKSAKYGIIISESSAIIDHSKIRDASWFGIYVRMAGKVIIQNCVLNGLGVADVIGGNGSDNQNNLLDVIVKNNIITQDASIGNHYDTALDFTSVYRVSFIDNTVYGDIYFGSEQHPHKYSRISGNTVKPAIGSARCTIVVQGTVDADSNDEFISVTDNIVENGNIMIFPSNITQRPKYGSISNNIIKTAPIPVVDGIYLNSGDYFNIIGNVITDGRLTLWDSSHCNVKGNMLVNGSGNIGIREFGSSNYNLIEGNHLNNMTTTSPVIKLGSNTKVKNNLGYTTENSSSEFIANGGAIMHGLAKIPTSVCVTPSIAGEILSVTAISSTTFTIAIKKPDGSSGTTQTIYWEAEV